MVRKLCHLTEDCPVTNVIISSVTDVKIVHKKVAVLILLDEFHSHWRNDCDIRSLTIADVPTNLFSGCSCSPLQQLIIVLMKLQ